MHVAKNKGAEALFSPKHFVGFSMWQLLCLVNHFCNKC